MLSAGIFARQLRIIAMSTLAVELAGNPEPSQWNSIEKLQTDNSLGTVPVSQPKRRSHKSFAESVAAYYLTEKIRPFGHLPRGSICTTSLDHYEDGLFGPSSIMAVYMNPRATKLEASRCLSAKDSARNPTLPTASFCACLVVSQLGTSDAAAVLGLTKPWAKSALLG